MFAKIENMLASILASRDQFERKKDDSPVSKGDLLVQELVLDYLQQNLPGFLLLSEELAPFNADMLDPLGSYVILDPIDGTENFVSGLKEWGVGVSIFQKGQHLASGIYLPELNDRLVTGDSLRTFRSCIMGLSSSLSKDDLARQPDGYEYRVIGCSMYNMLAAVRGSFSRFENIRGANAWDVLPGLNLALEHGCSAQVDGQPYHGQLLLPVRKYHVCLSRYGQIS